MQFRQITYSLSILFFALVLVLNLGACRKKALYTTADLEGNWMRFSSNKPLYDSMTISCSAESGGKITYTTSNGDFTVDQIKWKEVTISKDSTFKYQELGSDGDYYDGTMILSRYNVFGETVLYLAPGVDGDLNGNEQYWKRY